jgi:hypothetical protein
VHAVARALRGVGDVKALLLYAEMYDLGMIDIAAARMLGIPTVGVQHGTIYPMHLIYTLPRGHVEGAPTPDYFAAYSDYAREVVSHYGTYPEPRVWVTGGPRFDHLVNRPPDALAARRALGLPAEKRILLLATQTPEWFPHAVRALFEVVKDRDDILTCVKMHPSDGRQEAYRQVASDVAARNVRFFTKRFDDLLAACDAMLTGSSTANLEAILLGKQTICLNFTDEPDPYPYVAEGGALPARSPEELRSSIDRLFVQGEATEREIRRKRFLRRHAGPSANGAAASTFARRIAALIADPPP